jgi:protein-disulfide isomerase
MRSRIAVALVSAGLLAACGGQGDRPGTTSAPAPASTAKSAAPGTPLAKVGDKTITQAEVETHIAARQVELDQERYEAPKQGLDELVAEELFTQEAKSRNLTPEALEEQEIVAKIPEPSDADVQKVYDENKDRLQGQTLEEIKPRIVAYLKGQQAAQRRDAYITELKAKHTTAILLRPPVVEVATAGRPEKGGKNAPVTIIEFSDYECPFCKRAETVVDQVMATYGDKVKVVFRDYPLPFHANARPAAEAANCAASMGKFWEYHAKLFANQTALTPDKLQSYATEIGLDGPKFAECMQQKPFAAAIDKDLEDGAKIGVSGTPAFFINGRMLSGAQPFDKFKELIDEELAAAGKT